MAKDEGWGRRLRSARRAYVERHDAGLTYEAIGEALGRLLKRPAFKHSTVRAWFADGQEPDSFEVARALATVLEADAGYLITGGEPVAPHPEPPPVEVVPTPKRRGQGVRAYLAEKEKAAKKGGRNGGKKAG